MRRMTITAAAMAAALALTVTASAEAAPAKKSGAAKKAAPAEPAPSSPVLARVGDEVITQKDLDDQIALYPEINRAQMQSPEAKKALLDRMVQERVWLRAARAQGFDKRPEIVQQIQQSSNSILLRGFFNTAIVERSKPKEDEVRTFYDEHQADYTNPERMAWRHILSKTYKDALKAKAEAIKSNDFEKTAQKLSIDPISKVSGGWLGYLTLNGTPPDSFANVPKLIDVAWKQAAKTYSDPIETRFGWHIVYVDSHDSSTVRPFDGVRPAVEQRIANDRSKALYDATLDSLKKAYNVSLLADSSYFANAASGANAKNAEDLFRLAQDTQDVKTRLALYARVVTEYPAHELAAQAQFMIGFVNSEELHAYEDAEAAFEKMIKLYPKSDLVDDAEWMLKNMRNPQAPNVEEDEEEREHEGHDHSEHGGGKP